MLVKTQCRNICSIKGRECSQVALVPLFFPVVKMHRKPCFNIILNIKYFLLFSNSCWIFSYSNNSSWSFLFFHLHKMCNGKRVSPTTLLLYTYIGFSWGSEKKKKKVYSINIIIVVAHTAVGSVGQNTRAETWSLVSTNEKAEKSLSFMGLNLLFMQKQGEVFEVIQIKLTATSYFIKVSQIANSLTQHWSYSSMDK